MDDVQQLLSDAQTGMPVSLGTVERLIAAAHTHWVMNGDGTSADISCEEFHGYVEDSSWYAKWRGAEAREATLREVLTLFTTLAWSLRPGTDWMECQGLVHREALQDARRAVQ